MDWKSECKRDLQDYPDILFSIQSMEYELKTLEDELSSLGGAGDNTPVQSSGNKSEDRILNILSKKGETEAALRIARRKEKLIRVALNRLDKNQQEILLTFSKMRAGSAVDTLSEKFGYERTRIYELYHIALKRYCKCRYGSTET